MTTSAISCDPALMLDVPDWKFISAEQANAINSELSLEQMHNNAIALEKAMMGDLLYQWVGAGYSRVVFHQPGTNSVVKIPRAMLPERGHVANIFHPAISLACNPLEAAYYEQDDYYSYKVVPCRLLWTTAAVPVLVMEKVTIEDSNRNEDSRPADCWQIDGSQVAWSNLLQHWAAFDASGPLIGSDKITEVGGFAFGALADYHEYVPNPLAALVA